MPDDRRSVGVRVRPNATDFIRDLRRDLASKKYTFYVDVGAHTAQATKDVRNWANTDLKKIHASIPVMANMGQASRDVADWRRRQSAIKTVIKVTADTSEARREIEALRAMVRDVTIKVKADTSRAYAAGSAAGGGGTSRARKSSVDKDFEEGLKRGLEKAKALEFDIPVNADTRPAKATTEAFRRSEANKEIKQRLDIETKQARLELLKFRLEEKAKNVVINVDVKTSKLAAFTKNLRDIEKMTGNLTLIRSLDFGPFNLGKPSGLIGTLTTITALAAAIPGAVTGVAALSDAMVRLAGAASIVPGAIGALAASIGTLAVGTQGVGGTISAMFDMWNEGATQQGKSATRVIHAQNNYNDAIAEEAKAQRNVATARREALSDLRNLNNELRGGVLNEAQALLDLQKARDRYAQGGFDNETDRLQALLDVKKAEQNVINTREDNLNLQQKANDAQAKGVEGSDKVTGALQAQAQAAEHTAEALDALAAGGAGATTATQKFNDALAQLSPNARDFVETIAGLKGPMFDFRNSIQDTLFQGTGPAFAKMFDNLLPVIQPGMQQIAQGMNHVLLQAFDTIQTPEGKSIIERILGGTAETQDAISKMINPLIRGVGTLVAAGTEHLPQVVDLFNQLFTRFATFIEEADRNGTLGKFMDDGITALSNLAETGINLVKIVNDFSTAFRSAFGTDILTAIANITGKWHEFLSSADGQKRLNGYIQEAKDIWAQWKPLLDKLPSVLSAVSDAAHNVLDYMLPILKNIAELLERYPGLVEAFAAVWLVGKGATAIVAIGKLATTFSSMAGFMVTMAAKAAEMLFSMQKMPNLNVLTNPPPVPGAAPPVAAAGAPGLTSTAGPALAVVAATIGLAELIDALQTPTAESHKRKTQTLSRRGLGQITKPSPREWIEAAPDDGDKKKREQWVADHVANKEDLDRDFEPPNSYMSGGYTDWGVKSGRIAELHGGEYVQPHPTVAHYGVDAMKAVHDRRAVIGYNSGGAVPRGYPGNPRVPFMPGIGGGLGSYNPNMPGYLPGGVGSGMGGMTLWEWLKKHPRGYEGGGLVWDPNTGQYVQEGAAVSHGLNAGPPGPGAIDTLVGGAADIATHLGGVATTAVNGTQQPVNASGIPGWGPTGALPGPAPGTADSTGSGSTSGHPFVDSFLGAIGIPGYGKNAAADTGPGWGAGGPPVGLGGGPQETDAQGNPKAPFDIRNFGIGPGPPGSGPADWLTFTGGTLGKFGSSLVTTFLGGILSGAGLGGLGSYISSAGGFAEHFMGTDKGKSTVQGPGAADTNAAVSGDISTYDAMAQNPPSPGVPNLPSVIDPATGSVAGAGSKGTGLQVNTARAKSIIQKYFPWATDIGGYAVRPAGTPQWHTKGLALDVMIPGGDTHNGANPKGKAEGDQLYAWLQAHQKELGIDYILWQTDEGGNHYTHLHVNFSPSGYADGSTNTGGLVPAGPRNAAPGSGNWGNWTLPAGPKNKGTGTGIFGPSMFNGGLVMDRGGWLKPGTTLVHNYTGRPEAVIPSFDTGGLFTGTPIIPKPIPRPPDVMQMKPPPPPVVTPKPSVPAITPSAPPVAETPHAGTGAAPGPAPPGKPQIVGPWRPAEGPGVSETGDHVHPALRQGITSGFATAGNLASTAISIAASMGAGGATMGAAGGAGGAAGGGLGGFVSGLFQQAGKVAVNAANVASSFLVGNITGGTTANPYGVTQRGNVPTGGTKVVDASNNQYGDVYTNNLDEYFKKVDRRNAQQAQAGLGRWGSQG